MQRRGSKHIGFISIVNAWLTCWWHCRLAPCP